MTEKDKAAEYKRKLAEHDAEDAKAAKLFDPQELVKESTSIHEKIHPKHGLIKYGVLTTDELFSLDKITNPKDRAKTLLWMMLHKAYPNLTKEDVGKFPGMKSGELMNFLLSDTDFLIPAGKASQNGSRKTLKHRKQA